MSNELSLYHQLLFLDLRPWMKRDVSEAKYKELLQSFSKENISFRPLYEVSFIKPLTAKRKYYHALIDSEATSYLNTFQRNFFSAEKVNEKKYWVHTTLSKVISQKLKEASKVIKANEYYLDQILPGVKPNSKAEHLLDETYILQFLKYQLIRIYLEIQTAFKPFVKEDELTEEELHSIYFKEELFTTSFLKQIIYPEPLRTAGTKIIPDTEYIFIPVKRDIREPGKGVIHYKDIVNKTDKLARVESILFELKLIDRECSFIPTQGNILKMAAVYRVLLNNEFFLKITFVNNKRTSVTDLHVRKFLNHRYAVNIDKEFRNFGKEEILKTFLSNNLWIGQLSSS